MKNYLLDELKKQRMELNERDLQFYIDDFIIYCNEMEFEAISDFKEGAWEFVQQMIHMGGWCE